MSSMCCIISIVGWTRVCIKDIKRCEKMTVNLYEASCFKIHPNLMLSELHKMHTGHKSARRSASKNC